LNAFGVFQTYYTTTLIPDSNNSTVSWIGSIQAFLTCCITIFAGPLFDRGHAKSIVFFGSFMVVFGLMMASLGSSYYQLLLAQGFCIGIGAGCIFIVSVAIIPQYFSTKRAFAIGIAAAGSSLGGVIYPIVFHELQPVVGYGWATRIMGFIALATLSIPCACIKLRVLPLPRKTIIDFSGFKELPFALFCLASFVGFIGLYVPFFFITEFATSAGLPTKLAFYMLPIVSCGSIVGRILPAYIADTAGPLNVLTICTVVAGMLGFCWIPIHSTAAGLIVWSLLYGAFSGAFVSLQPSTVVSITDDMGAVGGRLGMNTFCAALGILIGSPLAGLIVEDGNWVGLQCFCGATLLLGSMLVGVTRWSRTGWVLMKKA
jgi:MFS family permease